MTLNGHLYLIPDLRWEAFCLSPLNINLTIGIFVDVLYQMRKLSDIFSLLRVCVMNGYQILSYVFSASIDITVCFFPFGH